MSCVCVTLMGNTLPCCTKFMLPEKIKGNDCCPVYDGLNYIHFWSGLCYTLMVWSVSLCNTDLVGLCFIFRVASRPHNIINYAHTINVVWSVLYYIDTLYTVRQIRLALPVEMIGRHHIAAVNTDTHNMYIEAVIVNNSLIALALFYQYLYML